MESVTGSDTGVRGTCAFMCPHAEVVMREQEGLLHPFEMMLEDEGRNVDRKARCRPRADQSKAVKQFSRPAAGRTDVDPSQLRPGPVLCDTVLYLFSHIVPKDHPAWTGVYEFVFDRLRAVRQDMVMQGIVGRDAIYLLEQIVRFHLYASYRLREAGTADFDPVINKQHLLECLKRLLYLYKVTAGPHPHQAEFEGVYLLDNLGDSHALSHCLELNPEIRKSPIVRRCYQISQAFVLRNYASALRLIAGLPCPMCLCAVNPHLFNLRVNYLQILSHGYSVKNCKYPLEKLRTQLGLASVSEVDELLSSCDLLDHFDHPVTSSAGDVVCFNKSRFQRPREEKRPSSLAPLDAILARESVATLLMSHVEKPVEISPSVKDPAHIPVCNGELQQITSRLSSLGLGMGDADGARTGKQVMEPEPVSVSYTHADGSRHSGMSSRETASAASTKLTETGNVLHSARQDCVISSGVRLTEVSDPSGFGPAQIANKPGRAGSDEDWEPHSRNHGVTSSMPPTSVSMGRGLLQNSESSILSESGEGRKPRPWGVEEISSQVTPGGMGVRVPKEGSSASAPRLGRGRGRGRGRKKV